jgi:microsomal dipeptidase-like Zn-dependent dipeptidase
MMAPAHFTDTEISGSAHGAAKGGLTPLGRRWLRKLEEKKSALVGIGYFPSAVCGTDARAIAKAMRYAADVLGVKHLALGSDFDGAVKTPFDVTGLPLLAEALRAEGFSDPDIRAIASRNALRFFAAQLP